TREVLEQFNDGRGSVNKLLGLLTKEGILVKISEDLSFHGEAMKKLAEDYTALLLREGKATPAMFRDLTNLSRKFIIPLMEYFDKTKLTMRVGDHRILRARKEDGNG
ncbi:MAG TPA: SelB C-terminal domain-containing protein, partial [Syntrophales bacterium]|nr:SelB C-terminal domain-containing protein [Syntrophales bacterium]